MFLKLVGRSSAEFRVIEVTDCEFHRLPEPRAVCDQGTPNEKVFPVQHHAFILNTDGKTVERFSANPTDRQTGRT